MSVSENLIVMITSSHFEKGQSDLDDLVARPDNQCCGNSVEPNSHGNNNSKDNEIRGFSVNGLSNCATDPNVNLRCITGEINHSITQERKSLMDNFKAQIQREKVKQSTNTFFLS